MCSAPKSMIQNTSHKQNFATHPVLGQYPKFVYVDYVHVLFLFLKAGTQHLCEYLNARLKCRPFSALEHVCHLCKKKVQRMRSKQTKGHWPGLRWGYVMWDDRPLEKIWFAAMCKSSLETCACPPPPSIFWFPRGDHAPKKARLLTNVSQAKTLFIYETPLDEHL